MGSQIIFALFIGVFAVAFAINIAYLASVRKFFSYLKDNHPEAWQTLSQTIGETIVSPAPKNMRRLWKYFKNADYKNLQDEKLNSLGAKVRRLLILCVTLFVLLAILLLGSFVTNLSSNN